MDIKYTGLRLGMRTLGRLSDGIRLGWETGFDSGRTLDYVYRNKASGITPLGALMDRAYLDHPVWKAARLRRDVLVAQLRDALARYDHPTLFDTAAGQGSYLFALSPNGATIWAGDHSPDEVAQGNDRARSEGRTDIRFAYANAFDDATWPVGGIDVLVTSGFFDILTEPEEFRKVLAAGTRASHTGSRWVFTMMEGHSDPTLLREVLVNRDQKPWIAVLRPAEDIVRWAAPLGWRLERLERERYGFFAVGTLVRAFPSR